MTPVFGDAALPRPTSGPKNAPCPRSVRFSTPGRRWHPFAGGVPPSNYPVESIPWDENVPGDVAHVVGAGQRQADGEFLAQDVERQCHTRLAARGECIEKGLAHEATPGAEGQRLEHVLSGAHAAIEQDFAATRG